MNPRSTLRKTGLRSAIGAAAFLIAALSGWLLWEWLREFDDHFAPVAVVPSGSRGTNLGEGEVNRPVPRILVEDERPQPPVHLPELPDASAPLSQQLPALLIRANAGDPGASCRLIVGINRCVELNRNRAFSERMIRSLELGESEKDELLIRLAARFEEAESQGGAFCSDVDVQELPRIDSLLRNSIQSMSPEQKTVIALMRSDGRLRRLQRTSSFSESSLYVFPQLLADHAYEFLLAGFSARVPLALEGLVVTHAPGGAMMTQGVHVALPNPRLFHRYALLMERLYGSETLGREGGHLLEAVTATLSPRDLSENALWVDNEYRRWTQTPKEFEEEKLAISEPEDASTVQRLCAE